MKKLRKVAGVFLALALAMVTLLGTGTAVRAEDTAITNSLTIHNTDSTKHTFELYQIFKGDYQETATDTGKEIILSNIHWGSGINDAGKAALGAASDKAQELADAADGIKAANDFVNELMGKSDTNVHDSYLGTPTKSEAVAANGEYTFSSLEAGYYLVKDVDESQKETSGAYTSYIVQVVGNVSANTKLDVPKVEKKVKDVDDSTGAQSDWQDSADYDIGDIIPYQITGTMPSNINDYTTYKYVLTDTMSKGLTYTANNTTIKINDTDVTSSFQENVTTDGNGSTVVTWTCDNLKEISGITLTDQSKVIVTYSCKLNENAVIGAAGNPNTVNLTFSNNPNKGGEGDTGKTPDDKNIVFTYQLNVNKYLGSAQGEKSTDAEFALYKKIDGSADKEIPINSDRVNKLYTAKGLDDGVYILQETKAPAGYNKISGSVDGYDHAIKFTVSADHDIKADNPSLKNMSGSMRDGTITFTNENADPGILTTDIIDQKGHSLPHTGGIGTRIFYLIGSILVIGAGVLLVTRRKMNRKS